MKKTFYLREYTKGNYVLTSTKQDSDYGIGGASIGTITLDVEPIKKEVEKVIKAMVSEYNFNPRLVQVRETVPRDAYDVKVVYKVKE